MTSKAYFSYVRVSTQRQGAYGTSLTEQQTAIDRYAQRYNLRIIEKFEERETAAKLGRPVFLAMLKALKQGKANGIVIHKIDRSARNLKDWADLGSLIDSGIEVHFANESLDLNSRGGRLSADIQAVVAADYIRNLREETRKGISGRLKQGLYPFPAPVGYLNGGKGNPKKIDSLQAPLVKKAFELYSSGNMGLNALVEKMFEVGLRNKNGRKISRNGLVGILKNSFYIGVIKIRSRNELFAGIHEPIVSKRLFDCVQDVFAGKRIPKKTRHFFIFRRIINCRICRNLLIAERKKGNVYYRCHTRKCLPKTVREDIIEEKVLEIYKKLQLSEEEFDLLQEEAINYRHEKERLKADRENSLSLEKSKIESRLAKLADAYVDEVFDRETYLAKKNELTLKLTEVKTKQESNNHNWVDYDRQFKKFLELLKSLYLSYKSGNEEEKREMVKITFSNCIADGKSLSIKLKKPFQTVLERQPFPSGSPCRATARTFRDLYLKLQDYFQDLSTSKDDREKIHFSAHKASCSDHL